MSTVNMDAAVRFSDYPILRFSFFMGVEMHGDKHAAAAPRVAGHGVTEATPAAGTVTALTTTLPVEPVPVRLVTCTTSPGVPTKE